MWNAFKNIDQVLRRVNHSRIDLFRRIRMKMFKIFLDQSKGREEVKNTVPNIVLLRLDGKLGDSITSSYLIENLKFNFPNSTITVVSTPEFEDYFSQLGVLFKPLKKGFFATLKFYFTENKVYDILINTSHLLSPTSVFLSRFLNSPTKVVIANQDWSLFSHHAHVDLNFDHITVRYQAILKTLNLIVKNDSKYSFKVSQKDRTKAQSALQKLKNGDENRKTIVLNSFAGSNKRNLNFAKTIEIVSQLQERFPRCAVVSIGNPGDLKILREWQKTKPLSNWIIFDNGELSFNAGLIELCDMVITPDTSIVHLACALEKPLVAIYRQDSGPEKNQKIWSPIGKKYSIVEAKNQAGNESDINTVDVKSIVDQVEKVIKF